ncbi:MAG: hypothetical protein JWQ70_3128 [Aeromicrobium sp.]|nr:hypothetical protein [Aeromicrobium sp.]
MPYFPTIYRYTADEATRDEVRPTHRDYLAGLTQQGRLAISGRYVDGDRGGALLIFVADSEAEARELSAQDPFVLAGLVEERTVREWQPMSGALRDQF